jgi:hypothetical protein
MQIQQVTREGGVKRRYVPGVGATPVLRTSRVGSAALVAPTPGICAYRLWTELGTRFSPGQYQVGSRFGTSPARSKYRKSPCRVPVTNPNRYAGCVAITLNAAASAAGKESTDE